MPSSPNYKRDYKQENKTAKRRGEDKDKVKRVQARRKLMKEGKVKVGDGKDVDHINGISAGNGKSNLRVQSASKNRSFPRTRSAGKKKSKKTSRRKKKK